MFLIWANSSKRIGPFSILVFSIALVFRSSILSELDDNWHMVCANKRDCELNVQCAIFGFVGASCFTREVLVY